MGVQPTGITVLMQLLCVLSVLQNHRSLQISTRSHQNESGHRRPNHRTNKHDKTRPLAQTIARIVYLHRRPPLQQWPGTRAHQTTPATKNTQKLVTPEPYTQPTIHYAGEPISQTGDEIPSDLHSTSIPASFPPGLNSPSFFFLQKKNVLVKSCRTGHDTVLKPFFMN